jgi:hypothetical protein
MSVSGGPSAAPAPGRSRRGQVGRIQAEKLQHLPGRDQEAPPEPERGQLPAPDRLVGSGAAQAEQPASVLDGQHSGQPTSLVDRHATGTPPVMAASRSSSRR